MRDIYRGGRFNDAIDEILRKADVVRRIYKEVSGSERARNVASVPGRLRELRTHRDDGSHRLRRQRSDLSLPADFEGDVPPDPADGRAVRAKGADPRLRARGKNVAVRRARQAAVEARVVREVADFSRDDRGRGPRPQHQGRLARCRRGLPEGNLRPGTAAQLPVRFLSRRRREDEFFQGHRRHFARHGRLPAAGSPALSHDPHAAAAARQLRGERGPRPQGLQRIRPRQAALLPRRECRSPRKSASTSCRRSRPSPITGPPISSSSPRSSRCRTSTRSRNSRSARARPLPSSTANISTCRIPSAKYWLQHYATDEERTRLQETLPARVSEFSVVQSGFLHLLGRALARRDVAGRSAADRRLQRRAPHAHRPAQRLQGDLPRAARSRIGARRPAISSPSSTAISSSARFLEVPSDQPGISRRNRHEAEGFEHWITRKRRRSSRSPRSTSPSTTAPASLVEFSIAMTDSKIHGRRVVLGEGKVRRNRAEVGRRSREAERL